MNGDHSVQNGLVLKHYDNSLKQLFSSNSPWDYIRQSLSEGDWLLRLEANIAKDKETGNIIKLIQFNFHEQHPADLVAQLFRALVI